MKLTSVFVKGLFITFDHSISLRPDGLTFIHSPNGLGKSTLVRMVYDLFRGELENLEGIPFERAELVFDEDVALILIPEDDGISINLRKNEIVSPISPTEVRSMLSVTYVGPRRLYIPNLDGTYRSAISVYSEELARKLSAAQDAMDAVDWELPDSLDREPMDADELLHWSQELKTRMDFMRAAGLEVKVPAPHRFPPRPMDLREDREGCEILFEHIDSLVERYHPLAESVSIFLDIVNGTFVGKTIQVDAQRGIRAILPDGSTLNAEKLSSGETQLLLVLYRLLFNSAPGSLVILDEPEISLHVSWQQKLSNLLADISRLRDLQIVVATHSPHIVHDKWDRTEALRAEIA